MPCRSSGAWPPGSSPWAPLVNVGVVEIFRPLPPPRDRAMASFTCKSMVSIARYRFRALARGPRDAPPPSLPRDARGSARRATRAIDTRCLWGFRPIARSRGRDAEGDFGPCPRTSGEGRPGECRRLLLKLRSRSDDSKGDARGMAYGRPARRQPSGVAPWARLKDLTK